VLRFTQFQASPEEILPSGVKRERMFERYQIGHKDIKGGDGAVLQRMYKVSLKGLSTFAADYVDFHRRKINIDLSSIKSTITKVMVDVDCYVNDKDEIVTYNDAPKDENGDIDETKARHHPIYYKWGPRDFPERMPNLRNPIRGYALTIDAPDIAKFEELAFKYLVELQEFIEAKSGFHTLTGNHRF
jgi:hypothetical protein